jgi:hypothetical protein
MIGNRMQRLLFTFGRFGMTLRAAWRRVVRKLVKAGLRCPECKGKGIVVNCELVEFVEEVGLPAYYAATMLAFRADEFDHAESLKLSAWEEVGLSNYQAQVFLEDMRDAWPVWECSLCSTSNHADITEQAFRKAQRTADSITASEQLPT